LLPAGPSSGDSTTPARQARLRAGKLAQFLQHPLMHRRIADDAAALVGLGLAGFKLRFDQRDILPFGFNKAMAAGRIFCSEMKEQSITARSAGTNGCGN
jgi:hypothetical protein